MHHNRPNVMRLIVLALMSLAIPAVSLPVWAEPQGKGPVKVFILAGQSNMVGDGRVDPAGTKGTLAYMVEKSDKKDLFKHLVGGDGQWLVRDDVWYFQHQVINKGGREVETADVAVGLKPGLQKSGKNPTIGPELQFGHVMGDHFDNQVLIIKTAWGGKSLAVDFRPPSAGEPSFELKAVKDGTKPEIGKYYRLMISDVRYVLGNIEKFFPRYDGQGYEIVGFGWHQGWNDGTNPAYAAEYQKNLVALIQDIGKDLGVKDLPVVIASSGFGGHDDNLPGVRRTLRNVVEPAQIAVGRTMHNVTCVQTRDFFRPAAESPTGASYHWNSNAETYFLIGDAMGKAMIYLLGEKPVANDRPNVVFILADDLGYGDVACYNPESKVPTPNLDKLAAEGIRFTDAHSPATVCTPSRYSLLTGRMAFRTGRGSTVFEGPGGPSLIEESRLTLGGMLQNCGYTTAIYGKWHVGLTWLDNNGQRIRGQRVADAQRIDYQRSTPIPDAPIHRGFNYAFVTPNCPCTDPLYVYIDGDRVPVPATGLLDKSTLPNHPYAWDCDRGMVAPGYEFERADLLFLDKSLAFIKNHREKSPDKPFFLELCTQAVHAPSFPAPEYQGKTEAGPHGDFIFELDAIVGQIMATLNNLGIGESTLVMFSSDNGPEVRNAVLMRENYKHDAARPWRGLKRDAWEGGHRVPFIARWPGKIKAGSVSNQTMTLTDVMATVASVVGVSLPDDVAEDSYDMLPVLLDRQPEDTPVRPYTLTQSFHGELQIRRGPWKYLDHKDSGGNNYEKDPDLKPYRLPELAPDAPGQLYNLQTDPGETTNLYYKYPNIVMEMKSLLEASKQSGRSAPVGRTASLTGITRTR